MSTSQTLPASQTVPSPYVWVETTPPRVHPGERALAVLAVLRNSWKLTAVGVILSIAAAIVTAFNYEDRREFKATILYAPLPPAEAAKYLLPTSDLNSLSSIVKSPETLQPVVDERQLHLPAEGLAERIEMKAPAASQTLMITLRWQDDPGEGTAVLNRITESYIATVGRMRCAKIDERAAAFQASLAACDQNLRRTRDEQASFYRRHSVLSPTYETPMLTMDLEGLSAALAQARRNEVSCRAQIELVDKTIDKLTGADMEVGIEQGKDAPGRRPLNATRLQQMIQEERRLQQCDAQLQIKHKEYERVASLVNRDAVAPAELDRLSGEIAGLEAQMRDNQKIKELKQNLSQLDQGTDFPPQLLQAFSKKLDLDLQLLGSRNEQELLASDAKAKRSQLDEVLKLQVEATPLTQQVEHLEAERERMQTSLDQLRMVRGLTSNEMVVVHPATAAPRAFGFARRWLVPVAVLFCCLLSWVGLVHWHHTYLRRRSGETVAPLIRHPSAVLCNDRQ